jgi:hypothetical protein
MMWFRERRKLNENVAHLLETAISRAEKVVEWLRFDGAVIRHALRNGGDPELTIPNDNLRLLLAEQAAALLMTKENSMLLRGRKHLFSVRPFYVPTDPNDFEECVAKIWVQFWPDCPYPKYHELTPDQRYFCFGPDGVKFDPQKRKTPPSK